MDTSWYPGNYRPAPQYPPHYDTMPDRLRVVDAVAPQLGGKRLDYWLKSRDAGLAEWKAVGVPVKLKLRGADKPGRVTLAFADDLPVQPGGSKLPAWHQFNPDGSDWIHFDPAGFERRFLSNVRAETVYLVAHEFGHSLGFGHGGDGIMDQTPSHAKVNAEEAAAVRDYWRLP